MNFVYDTFEDWYQEIEIYGLRAERLESKQLELQAAFEAARATNTPDLESSPIEKAINIIDTWPLWKKRALTSIIIGEPE